MSLWLGYGGPPHPASRLVIFLERKVRRLHNDEKILFLFFYCFFLSDPIERVHKASSKRNHGAPQSESALGLLRLDPSTEKALIRDAPPGQITFTLLEDAFTAQDAAKSSLVQAFADVVYHYSG